MLIDFEVTNYRSFRDTVTFSMVAAGLSSQPPSLDTHNVFQVEDDLRLLTSAAVYGANASGKSNLIAAFRFMREFVLFSSRGTQVDDSIPVEPFLLNTETPDQPSRFEVVFRMEGEQYRYGFAVMTKQVVEEWLYRMGSLREQRLFERNSNDIKVNTRTFKEGRKLEEHTRENALFLSVVAQFNGPIARQVLKWFRRLSVNTGVNDTSDMAQALDQFENSPYREMIEQLVCQFDVGISGMLLERGPISEPKLPPFAPPELATFFRQLSDAMSTVNAMEVTVQTVHNRFDSMGNFIDTVSFDLEQHESAGTKRLFALAFPLVRALQEGLVLAVDEIDARIHPNLAVELVRLFNSPETNPKHAQLIFTTHNTNLLSEGLFRRDQLWFVEKSRHGASDLYSLVEYRVDGKLVRNDASYEKDYILGRYGAIPFLGNFAAIIGERHAEETAA